MIFFFQDDEHVDGGGTPRKNSCLQMEIENTWKNLTLSPSRDLLTGPDSTSRPLQKPLAPVPVAAHAPAAPVTKPSLPRKPSLDLTGHPVVESKPSVGHSEDEEHGVKRNRGSYKVLKIDNIPSKDEEKVEMRYTGVVKNEHKGAEKTLSYVSTDEGKENLKAAKAMFENNKPTGHAEPVVKSNLHNQKSLDMNSNTVISNPPNNNTKLENKVSKPGAATLPNRASKTDQKFVTVLNVSSGAGTAKQPVSRTASTPHKQVMQAHPPSTGAKARTLPPKTTPNYHDTPQSSIPPLTPSTESGNSVYSLAGNTYSAPANYSSGEVIQNQSTAGPSDNSYSAISNYSSANGRKSEAPTTTTNVYSYSTANSSNTTNHNHHSNADSALYSAVDKPGGTIREEDSSENTYDIVAMGKAQVS